MIKVVAITTLKPGSDPAEVERLWREVHVPRVRQYLVPELKRYVFDTVVSSIGEASVYFGMPELYFEDEESAQRAFARLMKDGPDAFQQSVNVIARLIVEEREMEL